MITLTDVLEVNWIILYFVYGQVFFIMGLVTGLQWRHQSRLELASALPWLAAFGIAHGLTEWGYIFIPLQSLYLSDTVVRVLVIAHLMLLAVSFFFLFQFGVQLLLPRRPRYRWLRSTPVVVLFVWAIAVAARGIRVDEPLNTLVAVGDSWSRYLLCLPGSLLVAFGLYHQVSQVQAMGMMRIARYLTGAAIAFLIYAVVGGLVVPTAPVFPANLLNYALVDRTIQVPVPVFRSLCGLAMAFFVVRSLEVFRAETDRRIAEMEQAQILAADRERIGRDLHDGIIQNIYAAGLNLEHMQRRLAGQPERVRRLQDVLEILNQTILDIRNYIFDLRPGEPTHELEEVLEDLVRNLRIDTLMEVDLNVGGERCWRLSPERSAHLTQIAREALSNIVQHARAQNVTVNLNYSEYAVSLDIADDGQGVAPEVLGDMAHWGQGLANMQERARLLGGDLALDSKPGEGLRLCVTAPCGDGHNGGRRV